VQTQTDCVVGKFDAVLCDDAKIAADRTKLASIPRQLEPMATLLAKDGRLARKTLGRGYNATNTELTAKGSTCINSHTLSNKSASISNEKTVRVIV